MGYYYNNYNNYNNGYYNTARARKKLIKDVMENYIPPATYKDKIPTRSEFGIENIDIEKLKKLKQEYDEKNNKYATFEAGWFALGGFPAAIISKYIIKTDDTTTAIIFYSLWILPIVLAFLLNRKKFEYEDLLKKYKDYDMAMFQYNWWQKKKRKDYWFSISGRQFELEIANIFKELGYSVRVCKQGGDEGIDIEIFKNGVNSIIQCKAHKSKISPSVARDLYGTMTANKINSAYLVTLHGATAGTIEFCREHNITIWDIDDILKIQDNL